MKQKAIGRLREGGGGDRQTDTERERETDRETETERETE